ncbi:uncharacterized protein LOC134241249 [Saccostrea cucullata]|uniref:uncharacterized protein LOC134241249 n=1 Tax=Saccostrea cuccullata TaxID=36930 RepID=UPI002ED62381
MTNLEFKRREGIAVYLFRRTMILYLSDLSLVFLVKLIPEVYGRKCLASLPTINYIKQCPDTREKWTTAAKLKGCENIKHTCTSKEEKLQYHCVINSFGNATLDVCAPTWYIAGYCTEFNEEGLLIQDHYAKDCTEFDNPCPTRYLSTDAYKYQGCYKLLATNTMGSHSGKMDSLVIGEIVMGILVGILFAIFVSCLIIRYHRIRLAKKRQLSSAYSDDFDLYSDGHTSETQASMEHREEDHEAQNINIRSTDESLQRFQEGTDEVAYESYNYPDPKQATSNNYSSA